MFLWTDLHLKCISELVLTQYKPNDLKPDIRIGLVKVRVV